MSQALLVGTRKGLFTILRDRSGWKIDHVDFLGEPVTMLLDDPRDRTVYASLTLGHFGSKLRRLDDRQTEWAEVGVPVYPQGAEYGLNPYIFPDGPKTQRASMKEIWSLETAGDDLAGALWAGTLPGGLFRSDDRGDSWQLNQSLWDRPERMQWMGGGKDDPGIHSICVDPRDSRHLTVAVSCGGVWDSPDAGGSWTLVGTGLRAEFLPPEMAYDLGPQDVHRLRSCAVAPEIMWVQHHNGIFHSVDGATTFREIQQAGPSTFGFAVGVHPLDANTAWFVPGVKDECRIPVDGKLVVTKTTDGGQTFETLSQGLPQSHCYDIVFRHCFDVDGTGEMLAMGSSTGGLWISEDGGLSWVTVADRLPQIYALRFRRW